MDRSAAKLNTGDMLVVKVEDFLAQAQDFGKQAEFIAAVLKHSEAVSNTNVSDASHSIIRATS